METRRPLKMINDSWIGGVCGGIAYAYGWPVVAVRIFFFLFALVLTNPWSEYIGSALILFYILFWCFGPEWELDPTDYEHRTT